MTEPVNYAFMHGGGQGSWVWDATIAALDLQTGGKFGRALGLDAPGCGKKRDRATADVQFEDIVTELIDDLDRANMRDVVLVGHSQAGNVLPAMAARRPDLFKRLIYLTCSIPLPGKTVQEQMGEGLHGSNPDEVGWPSDPKAGSFADRYPKMFCNDMDSVETKSFMATVGKDMWPMSSYAFTGWDFAKGSASVPSTYVVCLRDGILPVVWQHKFAERFGCEKSVRIDAGHQAMNSRPQGLAEIIRYEAAR